MAEDAKNQRRAAKGRFTRKFAELTKSIDGDKGPEVVRRSYDALNEAWRNVEAKHDVYTIFLEDSEVEESEEWIAQLQQLFSEAMERQIQYINAKTTMEMVTKQEELAKSDVQKTRRMIDQAFIKRNTTEAVFRALLDDATRLLDVCDVDKSVIPALGKIQRALEASLVDCKVANDKYFEFLSREEATAEVGWILVVQKRYSQVADEIESIIAKKIKPETCGKNLETKMSNLRLEKIKMPKFDGELREYPRFRKDFEVQVMPSLNSSTAPYTLRSCLGKEPLAVVKGVDDDIEEMWKRLDEKYGDPAKIADVIIDSVQQVKTIKEGENKRFIEFVEIVDNGYRDLLRLGLEKEITTTSSVSIIEKKLPADIRRDWAKLVSSDTSSVDKKDKFPSLLKFLLNQKRAIEYDSADLRSSGSHSGQLTVNHARAVAGEITESDQPFVSRANSKCLFHDYAEHETGECRLYLSKTWEERMNMLKERRACWSCLKIGHRLRDCRSRKACGNNGCTRTHHRTLHEENQEINVSATASACSYPANDTCLLLLQSVKTMNGWANVMWDNAASLCFITNSKAKAEKLRSMTRVELSIVKVGGTCERVISQKYLLPLIDLQGKLVQFEVYGIDKITTDIESVNIDNVVHLFKDIELDEIKRPTGTVDVLIGYAYAGYHPEPEQKSNHLVLLRNRFGRCLGGTHADIKGTSHVMRDVRVHHVSGVKIDDFYNIENLGVECTPRCGGCKCGRCTLGTKNYNLKEERELQLIERNLEFDNVENRWIAQYPWIRDPADLPDNRRAAFGMLMSTEKRLGRNADHAKVYQEQIEDMVDRGVARKLTRSELETYEGPIHYISHHEVLRPDSKSTPVRIVFNSSANYMGHVLNEYWAKGPDLLNSLLGVLIRFREHEVALIGDIKKMYHSVKTTPVEQHTHRFLWRDMNNRKEPDTYVMQRVSFGDRPSGTIATVALRKTAEMGQENYPQAAKIIKDNTYMDDIIESVDDKKKAQSITKDVEQLVDKGGFKIKGWTISGNPDNPEEMAIPNESHVPMEKVLGIGWRPVEDQFCFKVKLNFSERKRKLHTEPDIKSHQIPEKIPAKLTKRMILSQINSVYDPLGLAGPFTVRAKIMMRQLWASETKLDWDDPVPELCREGWVKFFSDLFDMNNIKFERCLKPANAVGDPALVIFSDGSDNAYGACAYVRWALAGGGFDSNLVVSKNRLAPIKIMSIDRIELCGAVLNKRLKQLVEKETRYQFVKCFHIVDSQIVHAMVQKESYGFNTFAATRIGEIQDGTSIEDWYWVTSGKNIADWLTRGKAPNEIDLNSAWQKGPDFLKLPESEWPASKKCYVQELPQRVKVVMVADTKPEDSLAARINLSKYSNYTKLIRVTARVLAVFQNDPKLSLRNAAKVLTPADIAKSERFWILEAQTFVEKDMERGKFKRLCPKTRNDGVIVVGGRTERWVEMSYNKGEVPLLPYKHELSRLYAKHVHEEGHHGVSATASKVRSRFWIIGLHRIVKSIKHNCVICKKLDKKTAVQVMGRLPQERLKPAPAWNCTAIDLFGPFKIRDEVKKRTIGKAYGVIFNCLGTRAVHVDLAPDYSTEKFLMVLRRFVSLRGYPAKLLSDNGTQLTAANEELQKVYKAWDWDELAAFGATKGLQWEFIPADAPWQNGVSEALVKSVKKAIAAAIGESIMTFSELQTVCYEAANLVNERPIGRHPTSPEDGTYLCPNDLLLGRSTPRVPSGPFRETSNPTHRYEFVQRVVDAFWRKWTRDFFPSLVVQQKWHTVQRNVMVGDVVLIQDSNQVRGSWKLGKVLEAYKGDDGRVRKVEVQYKNPKPGESVKEYQGRGYVTVQRAVHRLVVLVPADDKNEESNNDT